MKLIRKFIALFRLNSRLVCEESKDKGLIDYHDYPDAGVPFPMHGETLHCQRCGKEFSV